MHSHAVACLSKAAGLLWESSVLFAAQVAVSDAQDLYELCSKVQRQCMLGSALLRPASEWHLGG